MDTVFSLCYCYSCSTVIFGTVRLDKKIEISEEVKNVLQFESLRKEHFL